MPSSQYILSLPFQLGGFNIPRIEAKIQALRLNTLRPLLTEEDAHWKNFTGYFLRVSNMQLGKLTPALQYSPRQIDHDIPTFYRELLIAWYKHQHLRTRSHIPSKLPDILNEPLFQNERITVDNQPLLIQTGCLQGSLKSKIFAMGPFQAIYQ